MTQFVELEARKYFSNILSEYLKTNSSYDHFWQSKEKGLLEIDEIMKGINEKYFTEEKTYHNPSQSFMEFQDEKVKRIFTLLKEIELEIEIKFYDRFENFELRFILEQYNIYKNDPPNYSFDFLEPLKKDTKELILQIEGEIKNRVWLRDNKEKHEEVDILLKKNVSVFKQKIEENKQKEIIDRIELKYKTNKFYWDCNKDRLNSLNDFFSATKSIPNNEPYLWNDLRHYLRINFADFHEYHRIMIKEILEDAELLRHLGYFDEIVTPSVSNINPEDIELLEKVSPKARAMYYKCLKDVGIWDMPKVDKNETLANLGIKHGHGKDGSHFRKEVQNMNENIMKSLSKKYKNQAIELLQKLYDTSKDSKVKQLIDYAKKF